MQDAEVRMIVDAVLEEQRRSRNDEADETALRTVALILKSFGIDEDDRLELKADLIHLRRWRKSVEQIERASWKAIITTLVTGGIALVVIGVKAKFGINLGG